MTKTPPPSSPLADGVALKLAPQLGPEVMHVMQDAARLEQEFATWRARFSPSRKAGRCNGHRGSNCEAGQKGPHQPKGEDARHGVSRFGGFM